MSKEKRKRAERRRNLARSIMLAWGSLRTHLADAVACNLKHGERWHALCCQEYAEIIYTNSVELHELTKIDFKKKHTARADKI